MAEKKKRVRATWTMVRALEAKLNDQIEGTSRLVKDCDDWREKFRKLKGQYCMLEKSNMYMERELERLRNENAELTKKNDNLCDELYRMRNRGFWKRVFNCE